MVLSNYSKTAIGSRNRLSLSAGLRCSNDRGCGHFTQAPISTQWLFDDYHFSIS